MRQTRKSQPFAAPESTAAASWKSHGWRIALLWVAIGIAYVNSFSSGLVLDNAVIIGTDPRIRAVTAENLHSIFAQGYWHTGESGLYRPFATLSYLANYAVLGNGTNPAGYHWVNLVLHGINVTLVYALGLSLFEAAGPALALAGLWGLHPALTESVTNIVGRADLLSTLGVLAGLLFFIRDGRSTRAMAGIAVAQTVGIFSKESAAVLPVLMLLYDAIWRRSTWKERIPAYVASLVPLAIFAAIRSTVISGMRIGFADNPLTGANFWIARLTAFKALGKLLGIFVWPAYLSADYSYNAIPLFGQGSGDFTAIVTILLCAAAIFFAISWRASHKLAAFFVSFALIALLPSSNLLVLIGSILAERFLYLPSIGLAALVVWAIWKLKPPVAWIAAGVLCIALGARTYARNVDWQDAYSLWSSAVQVVPESSKAHNNLGTTLMPARMPEAIAEFQTALKIYPDFTDAHYNLASAYSQTGKFAEAVNEYRAALRLFSDSPDAHGGLAEALAKIPGRREEALDEYRTALRLRPQSAEIHNNLGILLAQIPGRTQDAIAEYQAALRLKPDYPEAHLNLAMLLAAMPGRSGDAISEFRSAIALRPGFAEAHYDLANLLAQVPGKDADAIAEYRDAIRANPNYVEAHTNLAILLTRIPQRGDEAVAEFRAVAALRPGDPQAHVNLGRALLGFPGKESEAIAEFEKALQIAPDPAGRQMVDELRRRHHL